MMCRLFAYVGLCGLVVSQDDVQTVQVQLSQDTEKLPVVLWGIESNSNPAYEAIVEAQLRTWAKPIPRNELIIVGGKFDDHEVGLEKDGRAGGCDDGPSGLGCKEAVLLSRAAVRAKELNADWVMVAQEDKYVWSKNAMKALSRLDSSSALVVGGFGCGRGWAWAPESLNNSLPIPKGWVEPPLSCDAVHEHGGLCGGNTYFLSRGALDRILKPGQNQAQFLEEFDKPRLQNPGANSDMLASCVYHDRGVSFQAYEGVTGHSRTFDEGAAVVEIIKSMQEPVAAHLNLHKENIPQMIDDLYQLEI